VGSALWVGVKHFRLRLFELRGPIFQQETNTFQLLTITIAFTITSTKLLLCVLEKGWLKLHHNAPPENLLYGSAGVLAGSEGSSETVVISACKTAKCVFLSHLHSLQQY